MRGASAEQRQQIRHERSRVIVDDLRIFLEAKNRQVSAKAKLGEAIRYALTRWDGLSRFLDDGRVDLDSNTVERNIRPLALNRKNALFAGSGEGGDNWAGTLRAHRKLQAQRHQSAYMADSGARKIGQRSPGKQRRRTHAMDCRGLRTSLTQQLEVVGPNPQLPLCWQRRKLRPSLPETTLAMS